MDRKEFERLEENWFWISQIKCELQLQCSIEFQFFNLFIIIISSYENKNQLIVTIRMINIKHISSFFSGYELI